MEVIIRERSVNGRCGVDVVSDQKIDLPYSPIHAILDHKLVPLGVSAGISVFKLVPEDGTFAVIGNDLDPVEGSGAVLLKKESLQGNQYVSVLNTREGAILRWTGYKGRSSGFYAITRNGVKDVPASVLLALGLIEPDEAPYEEVQPAAPPNTAMLEQLREAGLL